MSDDEEVPFVKKPRTIHYGSLEDAERARLAEENDEDSNDKDEEASANALQAPPSSGNIPIKLISLFISNKTIKKGYIV